MQKLRSIQMLRAVAACAVVYFHAHLWAIPPLPRNVGAAGVDLFFVISGFIMANVAKGRTAPQFLFDRFWRIYPLWWTAAIPSLIILSGYSGYRLAASLTLWPIYGNWFSAPLPGVGWTLCFEMLFYVAMALAMVTRPFVPLMIFAFALACSDRSALFGYLGHPIILEFLFGVGIALLPRKTIAGLFVPAGVLALGLSGDYSHFPEPDVAIYRVLAWGIPAAAIVYGCLCLERYFASPWWSFPVLLGDASYSIYLFHPLVIQWALMPWFVEFAGAIAFGVMVHFVIERRIIRLKPHWHSRQNQHELSEMSVEHAMAPLNLSSK